MRDMQVNFSLGQLSPRTSGRIDAEMHRAGVIEMTNFISLPQGPAEARPGLLRIDDLDEAEKQYRVIHMAVDYTTSLLLVVNEKRIYVYGIKQNTDLVNAYPLVDDLGDKIYADINYLEEDLFDIQFISYEGNMYMAHPRYELKVLSFDPVNQGIQVTAFAADYRRWKDVEDYVYLIGDTVYHEGKIYRSLVDNPDGLSVVSDDTEDYYHSPTSEIVPTLEHKTDPIPPWEDTMETIGDMCVYDSQVWVLGTKESADKDGDYVSWYYPVPLPVWIDSRGKEHIAWADCDSRLIRVWRAERAPGAPEPDPSGKAWLLVCSLPLGANALNYYDHTNHPYFVGDFFYFEGGIYIVIRDTPGNNPPYPNDKVVGDWVYVTDAPTFSSEGNFPNLIVFHDRRMYVLGTTRKPGTIYASKTSQILDFTMGTDPDSGFQITLNTEIAERTTWARSRRDLIIGSAKSEWVISGGDGPITPTSVFAFPQSRAGAMRGGAIDISDMLVFFQKGGRRLLRFVFSNDTQSYITPDMTQLSEDIFEVGVREFALQSNPDFILWCVMNDGTVVAGTYDPVNQSFGWHRHDTEGTFESVVVTVNATGEDEVWFIVQRRVGLIIERQLEKFAPRHQRELDSMVYVDDAEVIAVIDGKGVVSEDKYNSTLTVLYGGAAHPDIVADEEGNVEFQNELFTKAVVGRPYYPMLRPQRLVQGGSSLDTGTRISRAAVRVYKTLGIEVGADEYHLNPVEFRNTSGVMGQPPPLFTGEIETTVDSSYGDENWLLIKRNQPFPCIVLGVTYEIKGGQI